MGQEHSVKADGMNRSEAEVDCQRQPEGWSQATSKREFLAVNGNAHTPAICLETSWNARHSPTEGYLEGGKQLGKTVAAYLSGK